MKLILMIATLACGSLGLFGAQDSSVVQAEGCDPSNCSPLDCVLDPECLETGCCLLRCTDAAGQTCEAVVECLDVAATDCCPASCN